MINALDRVVQHPHRYQLVPVAGESDTYDIIAKPGTITEAGTPINRALLMAMQGFYGQTTVFNADGSITETNQAGDVKQTVFNADGSITETFISGSHSISKITTFNSDGSITEVIV